MNENLAITFKRGDIVTVDFGKNMGREKSGIRPAIVVSSDQINRSSENITVIPVTKYGNKVQNEKVKLLVTHFILARGYYKQLGHTSIAQAEDIRSISKVRVVGSLGKLSFTSIKQLNACLLESMGM